MLTVKTTVQSYLIWRQALNASRARCYASTSRSRTRRLPVQVANALARLGC